MRPVGTFKQEVRDLSLEAFIKVYPGPFFVHSVTSGFLMPTDKTRGLTLDRLELDDELRKMRTGPVPADEAYNVFELAPKNPGDLRLSVGCSSACDIQINDKSVSTLHAYFERDPMGFLIQDNNSAAGTQVNDRILEPGSPAVLASGDRVTLGYVDLIFLESADLYRFIRRFFGL